MKLITKSAISIEIVDVLVNGTPFINGVAQAPMPRELADSEQTIDKRRY
jgi:hypothetical protein